MRFAKRALALAAAIVLPGGAPADPLGAVAAAAGHAAAVHFHGTGARTFEGRREIETLDVLGTSFVLRRCIAEVCSGTWFDGHRSFSFGLNDVALPDDEAQSALRRTLAAIGSYAFAEPAFRANGGIVDAAGRNAYRVRARGGETLVAHLDPATLAVRRVTDEKGTDIADFGNDARVGGAAIALTRRGPDGVRLESAAIEPGPIQAPAGAAVTFSGNPDVVLGDDPVPIVPCTLGGRAARCLLDTGASPSAIVLRLADALKLEPRGELELAGFSRFATGFVEAGPLTLGAARIASARLAVIPPVPAARFDVVVGADLLGRLRVVFDRAHNRIAIGAPAEHPQPGAIPLRFRGGVPTLEAAFDGRAVRALFDSGDTSIVSLGYAAYRTGPLWPMIERVQTNGVGGSGDAFTVAIPDVRIGTLGLGSVRATVSRTQAGEHVGIGLWTRCLLDLDEARETLNCTDLTPGLKP